MTSDMNHHSLREQGGPCEVLLAEDTPSNALMTTEMLAIADCQTTLVEDGRQAVQACINHDFHLILMDVHMPEMDGLQATLVIRDWERQTGHRPSRIVGLTASAMPQEVEDCIKAGMNQVLTKPITIDELLRIVREAGTMG
jgi:CheY-like chemotaxis protein